MPFSCFGHQSSFKVTLRRTPCGKWTELSLNEEGEQGSLYLRCTVTDEQGLFAATSNNPTFSLPFMKTLHQA